MTARWARPWFALTALCVLAGVGIQLVLSAHNETFFGGSPVNRALNVFAYFTIQSNLLVGVICLVLAIRVDRTSTVFAVFRLTGLVAITVTFLVFHAVLARLLDLEDWAAVANLLQHTIVPVLAVVGWFAFGPRGLTSTRVVWWSIAFPLLYIAFTGIRGPLASNWYPYPFTDVHALGYLRVIVNGLWIALLFIALAAGAAFLDRKLDRDNHRHQSERVSSDRPESNRDRPDRRATSGRGSGTTSKRSPAVRPSGRNPRG